MSRIFSCTCVDLDMVVCTDGRQGLARLVQEVCEKAGNLFACTYYGPGPDNHCNEPRVVFKRRSIPRADTVQTL